MKTEGLNFNSNGKFGFLTFGYIPCILHSSLDQEGTIARLEFVDLTFAIEVETKQNQALSRRLKLPADDVEHRLTNVVIFIMI